MKNWLAFLLLNVLSPWVWGQAVAPLDAQSMDAARARITIQREQATEVFDQEDQACLSRFAVNLCQNGVAKRRRAVLGDLRRQELVLNEAERKEAGRLRLEQLKEKAAENAAIQAAHDSTHAAPAEAIVEPEAAIEPVRPVSPPAKDKPADKVLTPVDPAVLAQRRRAYADKQAELVRRQQERDKRLQTPPKPGLPTPP
ncbi:MAG: hypothetical protein RIR09_2494 [Pseudomonadota bacterium]|jgi:hypothetical protein